MEEGGVVYHYVGADGKIKRIAVLQDVADKLSDGLFGLALHNSDLVLLSAETVMKVLQRDIDSIVSFNDPSEVEDDYPSDW